ncbi:MAG: hypothetical protein QW069_09025 [Candidatus Caldarchaeum sp.]
MQRIETSSAYIIEFKQPQCAVLKKRYDLIDKGVQTCYVTTENTRFVASIIFYKTHFPTWEDVRKWCAETIVRLTADVEEKSIWNTSVKMLVLAVLKLHNANI